MSSSLHAALWLERFHLQAALRAQANLPRGKPVGLLDAGSGAGSKDAKARLLHANEAALGHGVHAGMTASQAQARCPGILFLKRNAAAENRAGDDLLDCAAQWTPDYEATAAGLCVLDLSRARGIAGRKEWCGQQMHERLAQQQLHARIGFAGNAGLAVLAAHAADSVLVLREGTDDAELFLKQLPVSALRPSPETAETLRSWGIRTLGQFARLPRQDLATRLGREGLMLHDLARGGHERLLRLVRPAVPYGEQTDLEHEVESLEPLLFLLRRMLDHLCARLADDWLVASAMLLTLRFSDKTEHHRELRVAEPTRNADLLLRVMHTHLDGFTARAPIVAVALQLQPARPAGMQEHLFERGMRDPNRFAETLAQLEAMLGAGRVGKACLLSNRKPDAFVMTGFLESAPSPVSSPSTEKLPLRLLRPAAPASVYFVEDKPATIQANGAVLHLAEAAGPWVLSGGWWDDDAWKREEWDCASDAGLRRLVKHNGTWALDAVIG